MEQGGDRAQVQQDRGRNQGSFIDDPATILKELLTKFQLTLSSMPDSQMYP